MVSKGKALYIGAVNTLLPRIIAVKLTVSRELF